MYCQKYFQLYYSNDAVCWKEAKFNIKGTDPYNFISVYLFIYLLFFFYFIFCWIQYISKARSLKQQFRRSIYNIAKDITAPMYFKFGKRMLNIIQTKLRHNCILKNKPKKTHLIVHVENRRMPTIFSLFEKKNTQLQGISCLTSYLL